MKLVFPFALLVVRVAAYTEQGLATLDLSSSEPAPAPAPAAPASGPAPSLAALQLKFEIKNYNYYDLTRTTCPKSAEKALNSRPSAPKKLDIVRKPDSLSLEEPIHEIVEEIEDGAENVQAGAGKPPWMAGKGEKKDASLLESSACVIKHNSLSALHSQGDECKTVMEVFRSVVTEIVRNVIKCTFHTKLGAGAPAAAQVSSPAGAAPQAFLQSAQQRVTNAPAPAGPPDVAIFVAFSPGRAIGSGRSVDVEITFTDTPGNGVDDVALSKAILQRALDNGSLLREMRAALETVTGIRPKLVKTKMQAKVVAAWNVKKCEGHVKSIVEDFTHYYTREQVPMALFNECTNFMTRMSFSNDYVLDKMDTLFCRKTTAKFAEHWNFGKKAKPEDFELMCVHACEGKFGKNAPQCNVEAGDGLAGKPLF